MKIRNTTPANQSVFSKESNGSSHKKYLTIPGDGELQLEDDIWRNCYAENCVGQIEAGVFVITEEPKETEAEAATREAKELADAEKLLASKKPKARPAAK